MRRRQAALMAMITVFGLIGGCQSEVQVLEEWMTGSFTSATQHEAAPEDYNDIHLHMVPIWPDRTDGPWLYVEQAAAARCDRPYRQRVCQLVPEEDGTIHSVVYELPGDPLRFIGAWQEPERLVELTPDDLELLDGCDVVMARKDPRTFAGGTVGCGCANSFGGASYATSEARVTKDKLISWDRGYNEFGEQVWGATKGGYVFEKITQ